MIDLLEHAEREIDRTAEARDHLTEIAGEMLTEIGELRAMLQPAVWSVWTTPGEEAL